MYTQSLVAANCFSFSFDISYWPSHQHWELDHNHLDPSLTGASQKYSCVDILHVHIDHGRVCTGKCNWTWFQKVMYKRS